MEGNLCWNCKHIATCRPAFRPTCCCGMYDSLGTPITHKEVAQRICFTYRSFRYHLHRYGIEKIMELINLYDEDIRYEEGTRSIKFYDVSGEAKELGCN